MRTEPANGAENDAETSIEEPSKSTTAEETAHPNAHRLRYQELFEFAPDCLLVTDRRGVILEANHAAAALFRSSKEFLVGKPLGLLVSEGPRARFYDCLLRLGKASGWDEFETRLGRRGELRDVLVRVDSGDPSETALAPIRWLVRDISDRRRAEGDRTELLRRLSTAQEDERRRFSRELHDRFGQELTGLTLGLKALEAELPVGSFGRRRLRELQEAVDRIGREAHEMALELRPTALDDLGLAAALDSLVRRWSGRTGVPVDFHVSVPGPGRFPPDLETAVYRVVQEALTNVAKHAGAARVSVIVECRESQLVALVEDDGRGFVPDANAPQDRLGLPGMKERVVLVGGMLQVESSPGAGTTVRARIPLMRGVAIHRS